MPATRSSARQAAKAGSTPSSSHNQPSQPTGSKRKASAGAPSKSKRGRKADAKEQTTIEASMPVEDQNDDSKDMEMKDQPESSKTDEASNGNSNTDAGIDNGTGSNDQKVAVEEKKTEPSAEEAETEANGGAKPDGKIEPQRNGFDSIMDRSGDKEDKNATGEGTRSKVSKEDDAVEGSSKREEATPSSILEKGIIYFFFRGRVGINEPSDVSDIARSYIILRPIPHGAKIGEGPIGDAGTNRMLALPKKVLPVSPKDRFMTFVEKANSSMDDIKATLSSSDYATKTAGARHTPAATPIGEGVYAITQTGRETHLAYILTIPAELSEVQKGIGLRQRGSYFTSAKNPQSSQPTNASLPQGAEYPQKILDEFHGRGWMPLQPKLLDYENTQFLIIGHSSDDLEKAAKPQEGEDEKPEKETPLEEIEKLEHEDEIRVAHLKGDDSVFADLGLSSQEYPKVQTTW